MNKVNITGRLTKDPELRKTSNDISVCSFSIAVNGRGKDAPTTFVNCTAWRHSAEFIGTYCHKGNMLAISGSLNQRSWEKDGERRTALEVLVDEVENVTPRTEKTPNTPEMEKVEGVDEDLPF